MAEILIQDSQVAETLHYHLGLTAYSQEWLCRRSLAAESDHIEEHHFEGKNSLTVGHE